MSSVCNKNKSHRKSYIDPAISISKQWKNKKHCTTLKCHIKSGPKINHRFLEWLLSVVSGVFDPCQSHMTQLAAVLTPQITFEFGAICHWDRTRNNFLVEAKGKICFYNARLIFKVSLLHDWWFYWKSFKTIMLLRNLWQQHKLDHISIIKIILRFHKCEHKCVFYLTRPFAFFHINRLWYNKVWYHS